MPSAADNDGVNDATLFLLLSEILDRSLGRLCETGVA